MKVPGLELPIVLQVHPAPWGYDPEQFSGADGNGGRLPIGSRLWGEHAKTLFLSAPELATALVDVTQNLVDGLEVHAPGIDPLQHAAVQKALAALAKARREA